MPKREGPKPGEIGDGCSKYVLYGMFSFVALPDSSYHFSPCTSRCNFASTSQGRTHQSRSHPPLSHQSRSHPPAKVASTSQGRIQQSESHPPVRVASTSQGLIHQSRSHPPVKVEPTSQGHTRWSRSHPPSKAAPTSQGRVATWRALWQSAVRSACPAVLNTNRNLPYASDRQAVSQFSVGP